MKKENVQLITVGSFLKDLKKSEEERWSDCVVAWIADEDRTFGVVGMGKDENGDLQIVVEEVDEVLEGIWSVADVVTSLEDSDKDARVYLAGDGLYLAIDNEGGIFTEADDDDVVGCWVTVFGEYEEEPQGGQTEKEVRNLSWKEVWKNKAKERNSILEIVTFLLCIPLTAYGLYYNIAALVKHSNPVWESALWIPFLALLLYVCINNLFFPDRWK